MAEPENTCLSGCVASTPTRVEVPVLQPARTPYSLPKAFGSPAVFTGSPESSNIDNTLVTGTPRPILEQARSPNPLPKAFDSPAVFTGPPESSDIDFAVGSGTASAIADRFVAMEVRRAASCIIWQQDNALNALISPLLACDLHRNLLLAVQG